MSRLRNLLQRVRWWLQGRWTCIRCGRVWHGFTFGYGDFICPLCFKGEQPWLWRRSILTGRQIE
jgi:hypothetical protein